MISIFAADDERLPITWHGIDYNGMTDTEWGQIYPNESVGLFVDNIAFSTPFTFVSETEPDIVKTGGGIELYNLRNSSRILQLSCRLQGRTLEERDAWIEEIQSDFAPLKLQWQYGTWPPENTVGRPEWLDTLPLEFTRMNDGSHNPGIADVWGDGRVELQYYVVPIELPDPIISDVLTGYGAFVNLRFLVMDGGRAYARDEMSLVGNGTIVPTWGPAPNYPVFSTTMTGAGSATLTITSSGVSGYTPAPLVLNASGLVNTDVLTVNCRDRQILVDGVPTMGLYVSGDYPIFGGYGDTNTVAWSNTTNTSNRTTTFRQATYV